MYVFFWLVNGAHQQCAHTVAHQSYSDDEVQFLGAMHVSILYSHDSKCLNTLCLDKSYPGNLGVLSQFALHQQNCTFGF